MTSTMSRSLHRDHPDDLRRKLALLEGDRKAYYESSQTSMRNNKALINALRKENKAMAARIKDEKGGGKQQASSGAEVSKLKEKLHTMVDKHNSLRHQCAAKQKQLVVVDKSLFEIAKEEAALDTDKGGAADTIQIKKLENKLDKATIKAQEGHHIGRTYKQIIHKMKQDRLSFDNQVTELEKAIKQRNQELVKLESMCTDAELARNHARTTLSELDQELGQSRVERQKEKQRLNSLAEERRRQYDAMEKRLRHAASGIKKEEDNGADASEIRWKVLSYQDAMKAIRDATGVADVEEVVERFLAQGETHSHLQDLLSKNREQLTTLQDENARLTKQFEALKYSGEARNTGNQRMLSEFESHLAEIEGKCVTSRDAALRSTQVYVDLKTGIENLHDKLDQLKPVQFRAAANVQDKLTEAELRLARLVEELEHRRSELPGGFEAESIPNILPEYNTRVLFESEAQVGDSDESDDDDVTSRDAMKMAAQSIVESKASKKRGKAKRGK